MAMSSAESGIAKSDRLSAAFDIAGPPLLFGFRLWASVCLTLYVAFWLELDTPLGRPHPQPSCVNRSSAHRCARDGAA